MYVIFNFGSKMLFLNTKNKICCYFNGVIRNPGCLHRTCENMFYG